MTKGWIYNPCTIHIHLIQIKRVPSHVMGSGSVTNNFGYDPTCQFITDPAPSCQVIFDPDPDPGQTKVRIRIRSTGT